MQKDAMLLPLGDNNIRDDEDDTNDVIAIRMMLMSIVNML